MVVGDLELSLGELFSCFPLEDSFPLIWVLKPRLLIGGLL